MRDVTLGRMDADPVERAPPHLNVGNRTASDDVI